MGRQKRNRYEPANAIGPHCDDGECDQVCVGVFGLNQQGLFFA